MARDESEGGGARKSRRGVASDGPAGVLRVTRAVGVRCREEHVPGEIVMRGVVWVVGWRREERIDAWLDAED